MVDPALDVRLKRSEHRGDQKQDYSCSLRILSPAIMSMVAALNIVAYKTNEVEVIKKFPVNPIS